MRRKMVLNVLAVLFCILLGLGLGACGGCGEEGEREYTTNDIVYSDKAGDQVGYVHVLGDYKKTNTGAEMFGLMVRNTENPTISLVGVGKTESAVAFYYDYNGNVYETCKGSIQFEGETYYYNHGPFWYVRDVGNPFENYGEKWIYSARFDKTEEMVRHLLTIGDRSKLVIPTISTAQQLQALKDSSQPAMLANDIDLAGIQWQPIKGFKGALDGAGHSIKNISVTGTNGNFGLFDELNDATVTNLTLESVSINVVGTSGDVGALVGVARNSTIKNVSVTGVVSAILTDNVGGIAGYTENCIVENNKNYAQVTGLKAVGGVVGQYADKVSNEDGAVQNNDNYGAINGLSTDEDCRAGGVFGRLNFYPGSYKSGPSNWLRSVINCNNYGAVTGAGHNIGGVVGGYTTSRWKSGDTYVDVAFTNCINEGTVIGAAFHTGGIVGQCGSCRSVMNCENKGKVSASGYDVGGIVGSGTATTVMMCKNSGEITGAAFVGGIMGWTSSVITNCENNGNITATGRRDTCDFLGEDGVTGVGGIAGVTGRYVSKSTNNGHISSTGAGSCIGGIAGGMVAKNGDIIDGNVNNGHISVSGQSNMVGGIVGKMHSSRPGKNEGEYTFSGKNTANVTAGESSRVGGIIGYVATQSDWSYQDRTYIVIISSENSGTITGQRRVAGIVGTIWNYARMDDIYWSTNKNTGEIVSDTTEKAELYLMAN